MLRSGCLRSTGYQRISLHTVPNKEWIFVPTGVQGGENNWADASGFCQKEICDIHIAIAGGVVMLLYCGTGGMGLCRMQQEKRGHPAANSQGQF